MWTFSQYLFANTWLFGLVLNGKNKYNGTITQFAGIINYDTFINKSKYKDFLNVKRVTCILFMQLVWAIHFLSWFDFSHAKWFMILNY